MMHHILTFPLYHNLRCHTQYSIAQYEEPNFFILSLSYLNFCYIPSYLLIIILLFA